MHQLQDDAPLPIASARRYLRALVAASLGARQPPARWYAVYPGCSVQRTRQSVCLVSNLVAQSHRFTHCTLGGVVGGTSQHVVLPLAPMCCLLPLASISSAAHVWHPRPHYLAHLRHRRVDGALLLRVLVLAPFPLRGLHHLSRCNGFCHCNGVCHRPRAFSHGLRNRNRGSPKASPV